MSAKKARYEPPSEFVIQLGKAEALILQAFLTYLEDQPAFTNAPLADKLILYAMHGQLENELYDIHDPNYTHLIEAYRQKIAASGAEVSVTGH